MAWLLLTAYRKLSMPYPTAPSTTPYRNLFFQNRGPGPQNMHATIQPNYQRNKLQTFANALFLFKQKVLNWFFIHLEHWRTVVLPCRCQGFVCFHLN